MSQGKKQKQETIEKRTSSKPNTAKIRLEKRKLQKDRRQVNTYLSEDQRSGIADRRKKR